MSGGVLFQSSRGRTKGWSSFRRSWRGRKFYFSPSAPVYREAFNIHACTNVLIRSIAQLRGSETARSVPGRREFFSKMFIAWYSRASGRREGSKGEKSRRSLRKEEALDKVRPTNTSTEYAHPLQSPWIRLRIAVLPPAFLRQTSLYTQEAGLLIKIIRRHIRSFEVQN